MKKLELGTYQHYKGRKYLILGVAKHSETLEEFVTYVCLYENDSSAMWIRPLEMFLENVIVDGKEVERFKRLNE